MTEGSVASGQLKTATDRFMNSAGFLVHGENMIRATCDRKGRLYLQESVRAKYGKTFIVVEAPGELVLLPVPDDPVEDLREWGKPLQHLSIEDMKRHIDEQADKEVEETLNRLGMKRIPLEQEPEYSGVGAAGERKQ